MPPQELPSPGLGTMKITDPESGPDTIAEAIDIGYRHLDTAQKYENERVVGEGIARSDVPRDDLFVATKIRESNLAYEDVLQSERESADRLGVDALDLLYVHWPAVSGLNNRYDPAETLPAFNELRDDGLIRRVGVANFSVELLEEARDHLNAPIFANQVEMHPRLRQKELRQYARDNDLHLVAYCPLLRGSVGDVPELREIAEKHGATPGQVSLAWLASKENVVPIPKAAGRTSGRTSRRATSNSTRKTSNGSSRLMKSVGSSIPRRDLGTGNGASLKHP